MALLKTMNLFKSMNYLLKGPVKNHFLTGPLLYFSAVTYRTSRIFISTRWLRFRPAAVSLVSMGTSLP